MKLLDSRRLFGPNLVYPGPGAISEVEFEPGEDADAAVARWQASILAMIAGASLRVRRFRGGAALFIAGEPDQILVLCDVNEAAIAGTGDRDALRAALDAAVEPALRALQAGARAHGVPILIDDAQVSVGLGRRAQLFRRDALPMHVDWERTGTIPVALVTGTNGKTTSARLLARIAALAGHTVGLATTDGVEVGGALVAAGDYTGPDAARLVLRDPRVDLAVLETARGGILRRGLAVERCDVALLTNVSDDHLGHYGIDDVATMARVKRVVGSVADQVVVNAGEPLLGGWDREVTFSVGGPADWTVVDGAIARRGEKLIATTEVPITFGGAARYNVANALGAAAAADALGIPWDPIHRGLAGFGSDENPGRGDLWQVGPARLLLDFGHNPEGVRALLELARGLGAARLLVVLGLPGDRDDEVLRAIARDVATARPARVFIHDLEGYLRGREPGAVPALVAAELERSGIDRSLIERSPSELSGVTGAIGSARAGDLVLVFPHLERAAVTELLAQRGARRG